MTIQTLLLAQLSGGFQSGATSDAAAALSLSDGPDLGWLMGVVAALVVAVALLAFGFRKLLLSTIKRRASLRDLQIVDMLPLGGKRQLAVVRCYDRTFALGLGEKDVSLVAELDHVAVEHDLAESDEKRSEAFRERLTSARELLLDAVSIPQPSGPSAEAVDPLVAALETNPVEVEPRGGSTKEFIA